MSQFDKIRLTSINIRDYLLEENRTASISLTKTVVLKNFPQLLQSNYGLLGDCTLTSMTACISYYEPEEHLEEIYNIIETNAKKYFYNGDTYGTLPFFIKPIYDKSRLYFGLPANTKWRFFKGIGFNFNTIVRLIDKGVPAILSMFRDGRNYYANHSVSIVGYSSYKVDDKTRNFILVYDNWSKTTSMIDYDKLHFLSCLNY